MVLWAPTSHNISVQLTRRFLDCVQYAPSQWPSDYVVDFLSLLEHCCYEQGSLKQTSLDVIYHTPLPVFL